MPPTACAASGRELGEHAAQVRQGLPPRIQTGAGRWAPAGSGGVGGKRSLTVAAPIRAATSIRAATVRERLLLWKKVNQHGKSHRLHGIHAGGADRKSGV